MKTKLLSALAAVLMLAALAGCASPPPERGNISNETVAGTAASNEAKFEYKAPVTEDNTYTSTTLGVRLTVDEGWIFATDEELMQLNAAVEQVVGDDYAEQLKNSGMFYDMYALDEVTGDNIVIAFENIKKIYGKVITPETYLSLSRQNTKGMLESAGYANLEITDRSVTFAGQRANAIAIKGTLSGIPVYQLVVVKSCGDYMVTISFSSMLEDNIDKLLAKFVPIDEIGIY